MKSLQKPPSYPYRPMQKLASLSRTLEVPLAVLQKVAASADTSYRLARPILKPDGSIRQPFDALEPLKDIQKRIKQRILSRVVFPDYLTGSIKGQDPRRNATLHAGAAITICEDIEGFFPSTSSSLIYKVWNEFFRFSPEVAHLLTTLTSKDGALPQGAATSSHLANLVFWRQEHGFYEQFQAAGMVYSRYVDDVSVSSKKPLPKVELTHWISKIYGMMSSCGYKAKRKKQEIRRGNQAMTVTKLVVNRHAALPAKQRQAIRACVYQLERRILLGDLENIDTALESARGRVGYLSQMHQMEGQKLKSRIAAMRKALRASQTQCTSSTGLILEYIPELDCPSAG